MNTNTGLAAGLGFYLRVPTAATGEGRSQPPVNPPVPVPVPCWGSLLSRHRAPAALLWPRVLPSGKLRARFYSRLLIGKSRWKCNRHVPQPHGGAGPVSAPPRRCGTPGAPRSHHRSVWAGKDPFVRGPQLPSGSPMACTGRHCRRHPRSSHGSGGARALCLGPWTAIGPCRQWDGTCFSSWSGSEITGATGKSQERRCHPSREITAEKVHTAPHTG